MAWTKEQRAAYDKEYYSKNKERKEVKERRLAYNKDYRSKNRDRCVRSCAAWRKNNPEKKRASTRKSELKAKYGLTLECFDRLMREQNGMCAICNHVFDQTSNIGNARVDHCHSSQKVRGLLCNSCNTGIGMLREDVGIFMRAVSYLRRNKVDLPDDT